MLGRTLNGRYVLVILLFVGCGGGSSNRGSSVSGLYSGTVRIAADSCSSGGAAQDDSVGIAHTVSQNGSEVVVDSADGLTYSGRLDADGRSFTADAPGFTVEVEGERDCTAAARLRYDAIDDKGASVIAFATITCGVTMLCRTSWVGTVDRVEESGT